MNSGIGEGMLPTPEEIKLREEGRMRIIELNRQLAASQRLKSAESVLPSAVEIDTLNVIGIIHPDRGMPGVDIVPVVDNSVSVVGEQITDILPSAGANLHSHSEQNHLQQLRQPELL